MMKATKISVCIVLCALIALPVGAVPANEPPGFEKLRPFCGRMEGYVVSIYDGVRIPGAVVTLTSYSKWVMRFDGVPWCPPHYVESGYLHFYTATDESGYYEFNNLPQGYYAWTCEADGYASSCNNGLPVYSGVTTSHWILMWCAVGTVRGVVYDEYPSGEPIENVWVSCWSDAYGGPAYPTTCDWVSSQPEGTFTFELWGGVWHYTLTWYASHTDLIPGFDDPTLFPPILATASGSFEVVSGQEVVLCLDMR